MLEEFFGSKIRAKLLQFFFSEKESPFSLQEIAKKLNTESNSLKKELEHLKQTGIIKQIETAENKKYYQINHDFVLYLEIRSLFNKIDILAQKNFAQDLSKAGEIDLLIFSGIFTQRLNSGTDLLLVGRVNHDKIKNIIHKFEQKINKEIYYTLMSRQEYKLRHGLTDRFLFNILENPHLVLIDHLNKKYEE